MKKNVSINIGGIIFHVEEEGFEQLKEYLDTINAYFADFQESQEIITDIENRIAEIFLVKLKEDKQVINAEDVQALMATLGSIEDFRKAEKDSQEEEKTYTTEKEEFFKEEASKKLFRDTQRKILGGVAAGLAHYFKIDVLWIRLVFIILTAVSFTTGPGAVIMFIAYLLCWVFIPADPFLPETEQVKKLYRAKDGVVIAGVAKGLSAYFGVEVAIIRLLFVLLLIPGFAGFIIYLVLWLITPKANSLTDKMQMEGTPITLSNIEKSIKSNFKVKDGEETILVKILLFPFRLAAIILNGLAKVLGPVLNVVVDIIRVLVGLVFIIVGLSIGSAAFGLSLFNQGWLLPERFIHELDAPLAVIANSVSVEQNIVGFLLLIIPALFLTIAGISVIAKKWVLNRTFGFSLLGLYLISLIIGAALLFNTGMSFSKNGTVTETQEFDINGREKLILSVKRIGYNDYSNPRLTLYGYEGSTIRLEQNFEAKGYSRTNAVENAQMLLYEVAQKADSIIIFDSDLRFKDDAIFRVQKLSMKLYIPYNQPFEMSRRLEHLLRNTIYRSGYSAYQIPDNTWVFTEEGLNCTTCEAPEAAPNYSSSDDAASGSGSSFYKKPFSLSDGAASMNFNNKNFDEVHIAAGIFAEVREGSSYSVRILSENDEFEDLVVEQSGDKLEIYFKSGFWDGERPKTKALITAPAIKVVEASSAAVVHLYGFNNSSINFDLSSAARVYAEGVYRTLSVDASSAAQANFKGSCNNLEASASSSAAVKAFELESNRAEADASSAASIEVNAVNTLNAEASSAGSIQYRGQANVTADANSGGRIGRD